MPPLRATALRCAPRRSASAAVLLVAVTLLLVASTLLTPPAEAARRTAKATQVVGWSTSQLVVEPGESVALRVGVRPASRRVARTVALEWRPDAGTAWKTLATSRTDRRGRVLLRMTPTAGTVSEIRLTVAATRRAAAVGTAPRVVKALAPGQTAAVSTSASLSDFESEVLRLTNDARSRARSCGGKGSFAAAAPVRAEGTLTAVSRAYSQRMGTEGFFDHRDPDGKMPWDRANAAGYFANSIGENIAMGYRSPQAVVDAWLASDGHCANLMGPRWTDMGIGHRVVTRDGRTADYWTQMFGTGAVRR